MLTTDQIRLTGKQIYDRLHNDKIKKNILSVIPYWIASLLVGLIAVYYGRAFTWAENFGMQLFTTHRYLMFVIPPIAFVAAWWLVKQFAPFAKGSGNPQVIAAIELAKPHNEKKINKLIGLRIIFIKILSSIVFIFGGGVIGREGPIIHIGSSVFRKVNEWLPEWWPKISKRYMIMTGAAAGLAAAFNTPLGGIVFAMEELTKTHISNFRTSIFSALIISGLTTQALSGPFLYLGYPNVSHLSSFIFIPVTIVAIISGVGGSALGYYILKIMKWKEGFKHTYQTVLYIVIGAFILGLMAYFIDIRVLNSGKNLMTSTLFSSDKHLPWYLPILRTVGIIICNPMGGAAGIMVNSLSAGSTVGAVIAGWMHLSASDTNVLILSGMAAFLTGISRTPFTCAILVLEMTDRHTLIFHLLLAAMVANMVALIVDRHSFYDRVKEKIIDELEKEELPISIDTEKKAGAAANIEK
jgi:H+/Cl- antiporter ClcA